MWHFVLCLLGVANAFYLPGMKPVDYGLGDTVNLKVNKVSSVHTQVPYDFYHFAYCKPLGGVKQASENLGEFLSGDRIDNSAYDIQILNSVGCKVVCMKQFTAKNVNDFKHAVQNSYLNNWMIDGLPAASVLDEELYQVTEYTGFPVGSYQKGSQKRGPFYINNHVNIVIDYHEVDTNKYRIVGWSVEPMSIKHRAVSGTMAPGTSISSCQPNVRIEYDEDTTKQKLDTGDIVFTYGVQWKPSDVKWASRFDVYLSNDKDSTDRVQWFAISNSIVLVIALAFVVGFIFFKMLAKEIAQYNAVKDIDGTEESGWKLVHADVFRFPSDDAGEHPLLFSVFVGSGVQLFVCMFTSIILSAVGCLSPTARGSIMVGGIMLYVLTGTFAGFSTARLYKTFKGRQWQKATFLTGTLFPGMCFSIFIVLNVILHIQESTGAVPFLTLLGMLLLWFGISVPLVFLGAYFGFKKDALDFPVNTSPIPRPIPESKHTSLVMMCIIGGFVPFSAVFVELFFVMSSIWTDSYYMIFGFVLVAFLILAVVCAEVSIITTYIRLSAENYKWWWPSIIVPGSTSLYVLVYSAVYFLKLESSLWVTYVVYFGYMTLVSVGVFLTCGSVGFFAALYFNVKIYSSIKID